MANSVKTLPGQISLAVRAYERFAVGAGLINNPKGIINRSPSYLFLHPVSELEDPHALLAEASFMMLNGLRSTIKYVNHPDVRRHGFSAMRDKQPQVLPLIDVVISRAFNRFEQFYREAGRAVLLWAPDPLQSRRTYRDICASPSRLKIGTLIGDLPVDDCFGRPITEEPVPEWAIAHIKHQTDNFDESTGQNLPDAEITS